MLNLQDRPLLARLALLAALAAPQLACAPSQPEAPEQVSIAVPANIKTHSDAVPPIDLEEAEPQQSPIPEKPPEKSPTLAESTSPQECVFVKVDGVQVPLKEATPRGGTATGYRLPYLVTDRGFINEDVPVTLAPCPPGHPGTRIGGTWPAYREVIDAREEARLRQVRAQFEAEEQAREARRPKHCAFLTVGDKQGPLQQALIETTRVDTDPWPRNDGVIVYEMADDVLTVRTEYGVFDRDDIKVGLCPSGAKPTRMNLPGYSNEI